MNYKRLLFPLIPIATVLLLSGFGLFQQWMGLDDAKAIALSILIITAVLWITEAIPLFVTSFVIIGLELVWLLPCLDPETIDSQAFLSPFFSDIILLFLGGFVLSATLHKFGLDQRIAGWLLKKTGSKPSNLLLGIILVSAVLSMWMSNTATAAMMLAIVLPIIARIPMGNPFSKALALAIPFACNLGGLGTPIGTPPNAIAMRYLGEVGIHLSFAEWMLATLPLLTLLLGFLWFLLLKLHPPRELKITLEIKEKEPLTRRHYVVIAVFGVTCIGWLTNEWHGFSTGTVSLLPLIVFFGFKFLDTRDFRSLSWDILFMLGGGLSLGVALQHSGLTESIVELIPANPTVAFILFAVLASVMTTFMSNTATANLLIPIAVSLGNNVAILVVTIAVMCSASMALPVSTPPNAIAFGSGLLRSKDMILPGLIIALVALAIVLFLAPLYWKWIGIF